MNEHHEKDEQFPNDRAFTPIEQPASGPLKHSGLGIASFVLSLVSIVAFIGVTIGIIVLVSNEIDFSTFIDSEGQPTMTEEELIDKLQPLLGYLIMYPLVLVLNVIGLILGIVGLARRGYKKVFPVLGTVFNGLAILGVFLLMIIAFVQNSL